MAIVSIKEQHQRRRSSIKDGKRSETRVFQVASDNATDGTALAVTATIMNGETVVAAVPTYGSGFPGIDALRATSIDAEPVQNSDRVFQVTVEYTPNEIATSDTNPLTRPWEISWGSGEASEAYFLDCSTPDKKPVVNSAGEPFEQFMERERGEMTITVTRNEATHDANAAEAFSHTTNKSVVTIDGTGYAPGTLKLSPIQATKQTEAISVNGVPQTVTYYRKTYTFKARRDGWDDKPLDVGLNELVGSTIAGFKLKPIVDVAAMPIKRPYPLDGQGKRKKNPTDKPEELTFKPYVAADWSPLAFA